MATAIPRAEFVDRFDLPDWRVVDDDGTDTIVAAFVAPGFGAGGELVATIARAADEMDHHPDLELAYPGRVAVQLTSHDAGGLTERDAELATTISVLARASEAVVDRTD